MSYHIYHTEAIVLGGRSVGEGDRMLYCYTRELGFVAAHTKSIREGRSKLRYTLQTFSHADLDLIRGKHGWKLISAHPIDSLSSVWRHPAKRRIIAEHTHLIRRLIHGEERHELLFDDLLAGIQFLRRLEDDAELSAAELLLVVRVLAHLGYWGKEADFAPVFTENVWTPEGLRFAQQERAPLLSGVNRAIEASNL
jgi:recombinational DNA repair protein (RecF pathway)